MRINISIELRQRGRIAFLALCAAHDDDFLECLHNTRLLTYRQCNVCQWTDRDQSDLAGRRQNLLDQKIDSMLSDRQGARRRKPGIPETCLSVCFEREQRWLYERQFTSLCNGNLAGVCQFQN